jgi:hypothetical protein
MKRTINDFRAMFSANEILTTQQISFIKGGDGDDLRRDTFRILTGSGTTTTTTTTTTKPNGK